MEETNKTEEKKYRVNLKQSSKGDWYGEFTIRGDDWSTLKGEIIKVKGEVEEICQKRNDN